MRGAAPITIRGAYHSASEGRPTAVLNLRSLSAAEIVTHDE
jgi:hypothetical protein